LNYDGKLYSISKCFQNEKFDLKTAIKIITYNEEKFKKMKEVEDKFDKKLNGIVDEEPETKPNGTVKDELDTKPKKEKKEKISK
jgi:hypothetical protein